MNYDLKFIFTPVHADPNFILRVTNALAGMLNQTSRLPRIIILLLDSDFMRITVGYTMTEKAPALMISQLVVDIGKRKSQLLKKQYKETEPKFLVMKPTLRAEGYDDLRGGRNQRRIFNRSLEGIICHYDSFFTFNFHRIRPEKKHYFDETKSKLSDLGFNVFWRAINDAVRQIDTGRLHPFKELWKETQEHENNKTRPRPSMQSHRGNTH